MSHIKYFLLLFILSFANNLSAQQIFIGPEETNRKLTWDDFRGPVDHSSAHHAMTTWSLEYNMEDVRAKGNIIEIGKMNVTVKMEPQRSWCIREKITDDLLKHEQGHFDIGILCMREFMSIINETTFTKNDLEPKMKKIFNDVLSKYHHLGIQYDQETDHSNNKDAQQIWNTYFEESM